ncbi:hypothetical protein BEL04_10250 [Mucilaginibacter sp. PPCGB 2223]|uniref:DUF1801 domain-containing protein n=1 Tax=Mucilaginibacter sp. PPCGB 2223 TaxID=1886027 RepID=UPI000825F3CE|nr:DUF1801 domain-containing protein [Mucilaginibacter sp. PPCGB 2223]OCX54603.1 hypothetical protein BEL04_10250 [Mucilaginibacter sp. PPCGB 2223]
MSKSDTTDLLLFLAPFDGRIQQLALWLRDWVWEQYPQCNELIYDNYNALAFGWSPTEKMTDIFCSVALYGNKDVHFGFYWGSEINDPEKLLQGAGKQYRYLRITDQSGFPVEYATRLVADAYANSMVKLKPNAVLNEGKTIVKSSLPVKKRPGVVIPKKAAR